VPPFITTRFLKGLLLLLSVVSSIAYAGSFGRFGYTSAPEMAGFRVSARGIKALHPSADWLNLWVPLKLWKVLSISADEQTILTDGGPGRPSKIRLNLWDFGPLLYYPSGINFKVNSTSAPFLTWAEGSVGAGVPTPDSKWITISFRDSQPPIVLGFLENPGGLIVEGKPGDYTIRSNSPYRGWVRFGLPIGLRTQSASTAAGLGSLAEETAANFSLWQGPPVELLATSVTEDDASLICKWKFNRQRFSIPLAFYFAPLGGYPARIESAHKRLQIQNEDGNFIRGDSETLQVRFPCKRVPVGRGVALARPDIDSEALSKSPPTWSMPLNVLAIALFNTLSGRSQFYSDWCRVLSDDYYETVETALEPWSKQNMTYDRDGKGLLEAAVQALLVNSRLAVDGVAPSFNPELLSVGWRVDHYTGQLKGLSTTESLPILAIGSVAAGFSQDPQQRLLGAVMSCGLATQSYWAKQRNGTEIVFEPLSNLRRAIYSTGQAPKNPIPLSWFSEFRSIGDSPVWLEKSPEGFLLCWQVRETITGTLILHTGYEISITARENLVSLFQTSTEGRISLKFEPQATGVCKALIIVPKWALPFPTTVPDPRFDDSPVPKQGQN